VIIHIKNIVIKRIDFIYVKKFRNNYIQMCDLGY